MLLFNTSLPGMEMINYQASSPFRKELIALFQEQIDFANDTKFDHEGELRDRKFVENSIFDNWVKNGAPKFAKIVTKYTGLSIQKIHSLGKLAETPSLMYAVCLDIGGINTDAAILQQQRMTGNDNGDFNRKNTREQLAKMKLADIFDKKNSKLNVKSDADKKKATISAVYFDVSSSFCMEYFVGNGDKGRSMCFTAEELTAIMMHEIGHAMTTIERFGDAYAHIDRLHRWEVTASNVRDIEGAKEVLKQIKEALPEVKKAAKSNFSDDSVINTRYTQLVGLTEKVTASLSQVIEGGDAGPFKTFIKMFFLGLAALVMTFAYLYLLPFIISVFFTDVFQFANYIVKHHSNEDKIGDSKTSDHAVNSNNKFQAERWADEFSTRHGCGPDLITGLSKITQICEAYGNPFNVFILRNGNSNSIIWEIARTTGVLNMLLDHTYFWDPVIYEQDRARAKRIVENMYGFFKDNKVDGVVINQWLAQVKKAETASGKTGKFFEYPVIASIYRFLNALTNPADIYDFIVDGKLKHDLALFENNLDKIANNKLFVLAADLKYSNKNI